jgi:putative membrane-bound dehydrogenase-like protein
MIRVLLLAAGLVLFPSLGARAADRPIKILFLGDDGHHRPADRYRQIRPVLARRGIDVTYTDRTADLNPRTLSRYDGLLIYANTTRITPAEEKALLDFVEGGKGFIPLHCASYCFLNSPKYIALVGAQFLRHNTGTFRTTIVQPDHPVMKGFGGFESWDETYVHTKHNSKDRTVLSYRIDDEGKEPWTWVRTQGKGRVFYTAWGHDERTWGNPGFQNLLERGIRWAVGRDPSVVRPYRDQPVMTDKRTDVKPFEYVPAKVPFYPAGRSWGTTAEPLTRMQKPLDPAESMKHMVTPTDFEVRLFASEDQIGGKPICMNWDERGRLWVAVTRDYPNELRPEGEGRDRILILEDTKGDGRADKVTVFADKLSIPTSLAFANGGVVVTATPYTLFLKDTKGDGRADERRILFTGWGTGDTHAVASNLHYGLDNWITGMVGYSGFEGTVAGEYLRFGSGFFRFKPDGSGLEFLRSTNNNSWGIGFSEDGVLFGSTANGNPSVHMTVPNRYYEKVRGWSSSVLFGIAGNAPMHPITDKVRQVDYHGHFTAGAGHALYTARHYPPEYWNRTAFVCEPTGHLVATFVIQPAGSSFRSHNAWNVLASDDEWTAPVAAEVGPDGNVWFIDWYNYIVQHNPIPPGFRGGKGGAYETNLRDKTHGRIYRLVRKGERGYHPLSLRGASPEKLVETLKNDNMLWRMHAQRLLVERGKQDVLPALVRLAGDQAVDAVALNPGAIHALWTMHGIGALDGSHPEATAVAVADLKHPSAGVRRNAVQVLPRRPESVRAMVEAGLLHDSDEQVRLMSLLAVADIPASREAAPAILAALNDETTLQDRSLTDAATSAAATNALPFLEAAASHHWRGTPHPRVLTVVQRVAEHYARGKPTATVAELVSALAAGQESISTWIVHGLARGWPVRGAALVQVELDRPLVKLMTRLPPEARGDLVSLAERWHTGALQKFGAQISASFLSQVQDENADDRTRIDAAERLIDFRKTDAAPARHVLEVLSPRTSPELARGLLEAVGHSETPEVGSALIELFPSLTPTTRSVAVAVLVGRTDWTRKLLDAMEKGTIQPAELSLDQKQALAAHPNRELAARVRKLLARGEGLPNPDRQKVVEQYLAVTKQTGDPAAGKLVFKNNCAKCHTYNGEGGQVGPDLTGMAVHPKEHLLIDVLDPSRSVEGNFRQYVVGTKAGQLYSGLLASETRTSVEILDADGKKHTVLREDIEDFQASKKSLMPEGFEKQLSRKDVTDLLEFLTQRGKYLPLPLRKAATVVSTRGMFYSEESPVERLVFRDWAPKTFRGIPFHLVDPHGERMPNVVLLYGPEGKIPPRMPKSVRVDCNASARAIHLLGGVSGWGWPLGTRGSVSMIVRLHYEDGKTEDHPLKNGVELADYIRRVDVPGSLFAFNLRGRQVRYLAVKPERKEKISQIEFVKGPDATAPVVLAVTVETGG